MHVEKRKILDYLLNKEKSRGKAAFFMSMGFKASHWEVLAQALKNQAVIGTVSSIVESPYGIRYTVDGPIETPNKRSPMPSIRTVWIRESATEEWRLVTAYPLKGDTP
ncbi:DUF6883 domain-containing protein [Desulfonatronospira sp.]|uniref:DUF6883 domain-containing protein n=1 Tax=Desulfonatronospira sp. TaxID=1962951 RepID=UPI0025BDA12B|nr:DUF6883 domain-containing protein [Desulfonatronospira sp.]